ncbi:transmembrane protein 272 [Nematolebias whitei]|uniref:transmembrane protein 272 n=1 Tax=Nematolebias whitei TaxID=451745 RepID=UPI001897A1F3|nr:transmembrane protein 272 [Nematolebias whitei]
MHAVSPPASLSGASERLQPDLEPVRTDCSPGASPLNWRNEKEARPQFNELTVFLQHPLHLTTRAINLNECPRQPYIPIYLIVAGVFGLALAILACLPCAQTPKDGDPNVLIPICTTWNALSSLFMFCWFITGNVWIYSIYQPNYIKNATDLESYCNKTLYLYAFWTTTLAYILLGLFVIIVCCVFFCMFLCGRADPDDDV